IETHGLASAAFERRLINWFYEVRKKPPGRALKDALSVLDALAADGPCCEVYTRIAHLDGRHYLDLCNEARQVVEYGPEVGPAGWRVLDASPVKFVRDGGMLPLPLPTRGGSLDELRALLNVQDDDTWVKMTAWLLGTSLPSGTYAGLALSGEQGSGKSAAT